MRTGAFPSNAEWQALVASLETTLRLHRHPNGALIKLAKYLHQRTGGMIGSLSHLIRAAAMSAILDGSEQITKTEFIRRLPIEMPLRTTARPWFIHQLRVIAHTIQDAPEHPTRGNTAHGSAPSGSG